MIDKLQGFYRFTRMPFGRTLAPSMLHRHAAHAEALAIADCFGVPGSEPEARAMRGALRETLWPLVEANTEPIHVAIPRAAAYLISRTAVPEDQELLVRLGRHPDPITGRIARRTTAPLVYHTLDA